MTLMQSRKPNAILRLTINLDFNEQPEVQFVRAMLRRLNVLHARTRPRSALRELLGDAKLRDQLESGRQRHHNRNAGTIIVPPGAGPSKPTEFLPAPQPSKKLEVITKHYDPPKLKFRYVSLKEMRFEPPVGLLDDAAPVAAAGGAA